MPKYSGFLQGRFLLISFQKEFPRAAVPCFAFCKCLLADGLLASKIHLFPLKVLLTQVCQSSVGCSTPRDSPAEFPHLGMQKNSFL